MSPHWDLLGHTLAAQGMQCPSSLHHAEHCTKLQTHLLPTWGGRTELQVASKAPKEAAPPCHIPQPQGSSWGLSLCCRGHTGSCQQVPLQTKNTAGRNFSSAALLPSFSHSSTARFKTPEGSNLDFSLPTAASGTWLAQSPPYLPGAGMAAARNP